MSSGGGTIVFNLALANAAHDDASLFLFFFAMVGWGVLGGQYRSFSTSSLICVRFAFFRVTPKHIFYDVLIAFGNRKKIQMH
jgi:hypothetical protein